MMLDKDKWIFYTDLFGSQRWEKIDSAGLTTAESITGFPTLSDALDDAWRSGYLPGDECAASALEWHREPVVSSEAREKSAA